MHSTFDFVSSHDENYRIFSGYADCHIFKRFNSLSRIVVRLCNWYRIEAPSLIAEAPVVQRVDSAIQWISCYPVVEICRKNSI